jgi:hypothetical protein
MGLLARSQIGGTVRQMGRGLRWVGTAAAAATTTTTTTVSIISSLQLLALKTNMHNDSLQSNSDTSVFKRGKIQY